MEIKEHFKTSKKSSGNNTCEFIILHHTASTAPARNNAVYLATNPDAILSAHYVVGKDGDIYKIGEDKDILWHAGRSYWKGKSGLNKYSIGIEVNSSGKHFTDKQRKATSDLCKFLMKRYNISSDRVIRHKDIAPKRKWDIGDAFWDRKYTTFKHFQDSLTLQNKMTENDKKVQEAIAKSMSAFWNACDSEEMKKFCADTKKDVLNIK